MASPFPGMDPWLEAPAIWPDLHDALASEIRAELNQALPQPYYARLEMRPEIGIAEEEGVRRRIVPDVSVVEPSSEQRGLATQSPPRWQIAPSHFLKARLEPIRHH